jgi:hypothetical protein
MGVKMCFNFQKITDRRRNGAALIVAMIFICLFATLAVCMATLTTNNVQMADNLREANRARGIAESGFEIIRLWTSGVSIPGSTSQGLLYTRMASALQTQANNISSVPLTYDSSEITVPEVTLTSFHNQKFSAVIKPLPSASNPEKFQVDVTGIYENTERTIRVEYEIGNGEETVFNFGVATRGPLSLAGNVELEGVNISVESNVYIESSNSNLALSIIGNSSIAGDVAIVNPIANVFLQGGQASIGGETGQDAIDNHVLFGAPQTEFPIPDPGHFEQYITSVIDSSTDVTAKATYENVRIAAGTNPKFTNSITINGVMFIETPNVVTFAGNVNITGIIVGDGDYQDDSGTNRIDITGTVKSYPVTNLPQEAKFAGVRNEKGTFMLAPGFAASFGGNFNTLNGAIAANGVQFYGNAGGTINGSIINYSEEEMTLQGNSDLYFNRSGATQFPAGFIRKLILLYIPESYTEIVI